MRAVPPPSNTFDGVTFYFGMYIIASNANASIDIKNVKNN